MEKYIIGYLDEKEGERADFANLMGDVEENEEDVFAVLQFPVDENTVYEELMADILSSGIHCLVVDYQLSDIGVQFEGGKIIKELFRLRPFFPSIIYTAKEGKAIQDVENEILYKIIDKSLKNDPPKEKNFRNKIRALIEGYRTRIKEAEDQIKMLDSKRKREGLEDSEEEKYVELNNILDKTFGEGKKISKSYYSEGTNQRLDKLIEKTENLLNKLSDNK